MKQLLEGNLVRNVRTDRIGMILSSDKDELYFKVLTHGSKGLEVTSWFRANLEEVKNENTSGTGSRYFL